MEIAGEEVKCGECRKPIATIEECFSFGGAVACEACVRSYYDRTPEEEIKHELVYRHIEAVRQIEAIERKRRAKGFVSGSTMAHNLNKSEKRGRGGLGPMCDVCGSSHHDADRCPESE